jgi:hypothetical protein
MLLGFVAAWVAVGTVVKYAWPGRRLKAAGVPAVTLLAGVALGLVGFFVVPIVGLPLGFVGGVWLAEAARVHGFGAAWPSTKAALQGAGLSMLVELGAGVLLAGTWLAGAVFA